MRRLIKIVGLALIIGGIIISASFLKIHEQGPVIETDAQRVYRLYHAIVVQTGLSNLIPPIRVENSPTINAYNSGEEIVVFTGIIRATKNDDELALIIAHEIAHTTLFHFYIMQYFGKYWTADGQEILESMADKMGAFYSIKAGYNVCVGREIWKRLKGFDGDYLAADHPDMAYRYDQLNVHCE